jgi:hypothetical protein
MRCHRDIWPRSRVVQGGDVTVVTSATPNHGEVFTRRWVVEVLLDLTGYTADRDLSEMRDVPA